MKTYLRIAGAFSLMSLVVAGLSGCNTLSDSDRAVAQEREDMNIMRTDIDRLNGRLERMEMENVRIAKELEQVRNSVSSSSADRAAAQTRMNDIERRLQLLDAAREKDRQTIIDQLSAKISEILNANRSSSSRPRATSKTTPAGGTSATPSASGGGKASHEVQDGDTLSSIAAKYKVKADAIVQANNLQDPNHLRKGQKLLIP